MRYVVFAFALLGCLVLAAAGLWFAGIYVAGVPDGTWQWRLLRTLVLGSMVLWSLTFLAGFAAEEEKQ